MNEPSPPLESKLGDELLADLADEFLLHYRAGEQPSVDELAGKYPDLADRIRELFPAMIAMEQPALGATVDLAPSVERVGATIGRYKLLERIGEGGFGVVYMAEQQHPVRRQVALKVIKPGMDSRQVLARFEAERQALAIMDHPNIAKVFDAGATDAGRPYFVMELVRGEPITEFCDRNQLSPRARLELFAQVCRAVQHAHTKGVIHRDIKPTNVLVEMHDTSPVVKVIDFGVAKALGQELTDKTLFTGFAQLLGTPLYMSPEQAGRSALDIDTRSDIYSLGVLLYELLTGTTPFDRERFKRAAHDEICRIIREEEPPRPSTRLSESKESLSSISALRQTQPTDLTKLMRGELDWIVMKALDKDRARRYETATGLARDIERYLRDEPVEACPPSSAYRLKKFARRNKSTLAVASFVLLSLVLLGVGAGWVMRDRTARQARVAGQVELILNEVYELQRQQKWPEALAAARRAEAAVMGGEADSRTAERVRSLLKDLEFIDRLDKIRMQRATWTEGKFDDAGAERDYARAFRDYGVNVDQLPVQTSISHLKGRPSLAIPLASALDDWAAASSRNADWRKRLVAIARGIDPDPLRDRYRAGPESGAQDELLRLAELIDIRAQHPTTLRQLAIDLQRAQHGEAARRLLQAAQSIYPSDFWLNYNLAHALSESKDYEGAVRYYTAAVSIRPHAVAALNNLGGALLDQGKSDEGIGVYRRAIELDPKFARAWSNLGFALNGRGKVDEAIAAYRQAIELDPKNASDYSNVAIFLGRQGKIEEAIAAHHRAIELEPSTASFHVNLGSLLCDELKNYDEAIASFRTAIQLDPNNSNAYTCLGIAQSGQKKWDEAIAAFRKAIKLDPSFAPAYRSLGLALTDQGQLDEAITAHRKAIELDPSFSQAYNSLAISLYYQGKLDEAIAAFRKAIELDPNYVVAYSNLGEALQGQRKLEEAIEAYSEAANLNPNHAEAFRLRARAHADLDQWDKAAEDYKHLIQLDPSDHWPWYYRGCILAYLDRRQEYGDHCNAMLVQFADAADFETLERTTKAALLLPNGAGGDETKLARRAERAGQLAAESAWSLLLRGLAGCRAGSFAEAEAYLKKCLAAPADGVMAATARAYLAIILHEQGDEEGARVALEQAVGEAHDILPQIGSHDWPEVRIENWLIAQTALREAKAAILDQSRRAMTASAP